jgi:GGDEF domain-containing protein
MRIENIFKHFREHRWKDSLNSFTFAVMDWDGAKRIKESYCYSFGD